MFGYTIVHLIFRIPQIIVRAHVYASVHRRAPTAQIEIFFNCNLQETFFIYTFQ